MSDTQSPVPPLAPPRAVTLPPFAQRSLSNGMTAVALRRSGVGLVEVRLRMPLLADKPKALARAEVMSETLLAGTDRRDKVQVAADVQAMGGTLSVDTDADWLKVGGSVLDTRLSQFLPLVAEVLSEPAFPKGEVRGEAARLGERIRIARSQAGVLATEALGKRMYRSHPYGLGLPDPETTMAVRAKKLRKFYRTRVASVGSILVLVGDREPESLLDDVERGLAAWTVRERSAQEAIATPDVRVAESMLLVDRPGSVQSALRLGGPAPDRLSPSYPAFQLANLVFGGYFSSRLVTNLREEKGYTYSPNSRISHHASGSDLTIQADVATEVTGPALLETLYELGRMATLPVEQQELDDAREFAIGSMAVGTASHAGLAAAVTSLLAGGLGVTYLAEQPARLRAVTVEEVQEQAAQYLSPSALTAVVVGEADQIEAPLRSLGRVERA